MLKINLQNTKKFIKEHELLDMMPQLQQAKQIMLNKQGAGNDFFGWLDLPINYDRDEFSRILKAATKIQKQADVLVVVGIGGSYLGARTVIEALSKTFKIEPQLQIVYAGNQLSVDYLAELLPYLDKHEVAVNVISKSGTTTEPAIAFRVLKKYMENRYGKAEAADRIYATTDKARGALKALATAEKYETFVVPDDVGGRYSVLTAVGLLPIAAAGINIQHLMDGAAAMRSNLLTAEPERNSAMLYAFARNALLRKGYTTEILVNYESKLHYFNEWWKQLYGESEGKDGRGIFPAAAEFTTDLHSMGQFIQDGRRNLMETVIKVDKSASELLIPFDPDNLDGLNYLSGSDLHYVNDKAMQATVLAHVDGGVPNIMVEIEQLDAFNLGGLIYFFEAACGISGYLNGVNPFNQPGVEAYKKNMFALLGKPGYEAEAERLQKLVKGEIDGI